MKYCAEWLKTFISDVPVEFIAASVRSEFTNEEEMNYDSSGCNC